MGKIDSESDFVYTLPSRNISGIQEIYKVCINRVSLKSLLPSPTLDFEEIKTNN